MRNAPLAAAGLAVGAYIGLHPLLLSVPLFVMMGRGNEDVTLQVDAAFIASSSSSSSSSNDAIQSPSSSAAVAAAATAGKQQERPFDWSRCRLFGLFFVVWSTALLWLSDMYIRAHPDAQCLRIGGSSNHSSLGSSGSQQWLSPPAGSSGGTATCWLASSHGFALSVADYTPNIGLFWYFLTELFEAFRPFFKFVLHSHAVILAAPLALRFPRRPLFVAWALLLITVALQPYPSAGDAAVWMLLAPLALAQQVRQLRTALFLVNAFVLLCVLGPSMWHQWIVVDAANPNFFYSITLLLGVFHVVVLVQAVLLTVRVERMAAGKPVAAAGVVDAGRQEDAVGSGTDCMKEAPRSSRRKAE